MRLFVGLPLPAEITEQLSRLSLRLRSPDDGLRWSAAESWHITLVFLGNTSQPQFACVRERLGALTAVTPLEIGMGGVGFFDRVGIFFAAVEPSTAGAPETSLRPHRQLRLRS